MANEVRAAMVQTAWTGDKESMIELHERYMRESAAVGAQVMCFQELFYGPYFCQVQETDYYDYAEAIPDGPTTKRFQELATELGMVVVLPMYEKEQEGLLYNTAAVNQDFAYAIAEAVELLDSSLVLIGLSGSCLLEAGRKKGLKVASEVFGDRAYESAGVLRSRQFSDSLIQESSLVVKRVIQMVRDGVVHSVTGQALDVTADTVCVHGDTPGAQAVLRNLRMALHSDDIELAPLKMMQVR